MPVVVVLPCGRLAVRAAHGDQLQVLFIDDMRQKLVTLTGPDAEFTGFCQFRVVAGQGGGVDEPIYRIYGVFGFDQFRALADLDGDATSAQFARRQTFVGVATEHRIPGVVRYLSQWTECHAADTREENVHACSIMEETRKEQNTQ